MTSEYPDLNIQRLPLISCIMPTTGRRAFVPRAIAYFLRQDYPHKELVILDDGDDGVADLIPDDPRVRYTRLNGRRPLGAKRNACVEASRGDLIMHWDDDDWHAPHRISCQVAALLHEQAEICGLRRMLFYEQTTGQAWLYDYPAGQRPWLIGGTLLYTRDFWRRAPFPAIQVGEDTRFVWSQPIERAAVPLDHTFYVALIHAANTAPKITRGAYWSRWAGDLRPIMGADLDCYQSTPLPDPRATHGSDNRAWSLAAGRRSQEVAPCDPPPGIDRIADRGQIVSEHPDLAREQPRPSGEPRMQLNLGCFDTPMAGYLNVDWMPGPGVEVVDLRQPWPWADSSVDHVRAHDVIEHLPDKTLTMNELWRVLKPHGTVEIMAPTTDGSGAFQDPTHVSFWNRRSFLYYEAGNPYRERFAKQYGITAKFRTLQERTEPTPDGPRLTIMLEALKP